MDTSHLSSTPITLITKEGERFNVTREIVRGSKLLNTFVEDSNTLTPELPLPYVSESILPYVLEYMGHYSSGLEPPNLDPTREIENFKMSDYYPQWDCGFAEKPAEDLYLLLMASHYLEIKGLKELIENKVANLAAGKSEEQLKEVLRKQRADEEQLASEIERRRIESMIDRATAGLPEES